MVQWIVHGEMMKITVVVILLIGFVLVYFIMGSGCSALMISVMVLMGALVIKDKSPLTIITIKQQFVKSQNEGGSISFLKYLKHMILR